MDDERKDSGEEQRDEDEGLGPRYNISLLDQHQHLKEKAEGVQTLRTLHIIIIRMRHNYKDSVVSHLLYHTYLQPVRSLPRRNS